MQMNKRVAQNTLQFLNRVQTTGIQEAQALYECAAALQQVAEQEEGQEQTVSKSVSGTVQE